MKLSEMTLEELWRLFPIQLTKHNKRWKTDYFFMEKKLKALLMRFPKIAKEYEQLKLNLWKQYEFNRDEYTKAKTEFVEKYTKDAIKRYT